MALVLICLISCNASLFQGNPQLQGTQENSGIHPCLFASMPLPVGVAANAEFWKKASGWTSFKPVSTPSGSKSREGTSCKMAWDGAFLYLLAEIRDTKIQTSPEAGKPWLGDAVELVLKPAVDKPGYFHFAFPAQGLPFARFYPNAELNPHQASPDDPKAGFQFQVKNTVLQGEGYTLEVAIPWTDFARAGGRPHPEETWQFNLRVVDRNDSSHNLFSLAPMPPGKESAKPHPTEALAKLRFLGPVLPRLNTLPDSAGVDTSSLVGTPEPPSPYRLKKLYAGFSQPYPIMAKGVPATTGKTDQLLVIHQDAPYGPTWMSVFRDQPDSSEPNPGRKILETSRGGTAYDFVFHPDYPNKPYLYVGWNGPIDGGKRKGKASRITRYPVKTIHPLELDASAAETIIEWESDGHNGAALCFGPDGKLFVTTGDGTADSDNDEMGQRTDTLQAKLLRIDVDHPAPGKKYGIPSDNPFVANPEFAPETYCYGLRNPWRVCADPTTGQIWVGNNGQDMFEQAYLVKPGANYGWSIREGSAPFHSRRKAGPTPISPPTVEHHHSQFRSLTGGVVIPKGNRELPELIDHYIYGDYSTGRIWAARHQDDKLVTHEELVDTPLQITAFGFNTRGDLIVCDHNARGGLFTLEKRPAGDKGTPFPRDLKDTGLFARIQNHQVAAGVVPYQVSAPFWSDGILKERFLALPKGKDSPSLLKAGMTGKGGWNFPDGTVVIKSFATLPEAASPQRKLWIETRLLVKQENEWAGYSYRWDDQGQSAKLVGTNGEDRTLTHTGPDGKTRQQIWRYPSRAECMVCHTRAANFTLGLCTLQLNTTLSEPAGQTNQLGAFFGLGLLTPEGDYKQTVLEEIRARGISLGKKDAALDTYVRDFGPQDKQRALDGAGLLPKADYPRLVDPKDASQEIGLRARSWLHSNCSACHQEAGGGNSRINLEFATPLDQTRLLDEKPTHTNLDIPDARLIAPGDPARSVLFKRITTRGQGQMPPLATHLVDPVGEKVLREWIESLKSASPKPGG